MSRRATVYILLVVGVILTISILSCGIRGIDCIRVDDTTFQQEVLESQVPVLVIFCGDELWNRDRPRFVPELGYTQPAPVVSAIKKIIQSGQYEYVIKFCRYYTASRSDPVCTEYNIKWFPTTVVFRDGIAFWKGEGAGCLVQDSREEIEGILKEVMDGN